MMHIYINNKLHFEWKYIKHIQWVANEKGLCRMLCDVKANKMKSKWKFRIDNIDRQENNYDKDNKMCQFGLV